MKFTVYDALTGRIKRYGQCPDDDVSAQALEGEGVVEGHFDPAETYFPGGVQTAMPPRPSPMHDFDFLAAAWVANEERAWAEVRLTRDNLLRQTDWMTLRAIDTGAPLSEAWLAYRQALRDITSQPDPVNIVWPVPPA